MAGLGLMLPVALVIAVFFLILFFWSLKNGDVNDAELAKYRIIYDDEDDVDRTIGTKPKALSEKTK